MSRNYKLYFKYLLFNIPHIHLKQNLKGFHNNSLVVPKLTFYYLALHLRFGSLFYMTQLSDIFAYELPVSNNHASGDIDPNNLAKRVSEACVVYNFHNLLWQDRFFLFCIDSKSGSNSSSLNSIAELFPNASWLEREVGELHGITFNNKKDVRNLMLQYGDTTTPFQKSAPSIGYKEVYYDSVSDILVETPVSIQI